MRAFVKRRCRNRVLRSGTIAVWLGKNDRKQETNRQIASANQFQIFWNQLGSENKCIRPYPALGPALRSHSASSGVTLKVKVPSRPATTRPLSMATKIS